MSVSTETESSENVQQDEEQEIATQQTEEQETVEQGTEPTAPNTEDNNRNSKFDFEKSKGKLEYISIVLALISVITTGLVKVLSLGTHLQFNFDINNYEFKLTGTDFIFLFLSVFFCVLAIMFCNGTNNIRTTISNRISNCLKEKQIINALGWFIKYFSLVLVYFVLGLVTICLLCSLKGIVPFLYELLSTFTLTFLFVFYIFCFELVEIGKNKFKNKILYIILFVLIVSCFMYLNYTKAKNQKEFEIIVSETDEGQSQEYVVISKGSSYSAYQCSTEEQEAGKVLVIHTDRHRYFSLDDTETRLNIFDEYQLYKYGMPLDTDEEDNSDAYQSSEE